MINGRTGEGEGDNPYMPIARAALDALEARYGELVAEEATRVEAFHGGYIYADAPLLARPTHHRLVTTWTATTTSRGTSS